MTSMAVLGDSDARVITCPAILGGRIVAADPRVAGHAESALQGLTGFACSAETVGASVLAVGEGVGGGGRGDRSCSAVLNVVGVVGGSGDHVVTDFTLVNVDVEESIDSPIDTPGVLADPVHFAVAVGVPADYFDCVAALQLSGTVLTVYARTVGLEVVLHVQRSLHGSVILDFVLDVADVHGAVVRLAVGHLGPSRSLHHVGQSVRGWAGGGSVDVGSDARGGAHSVLGRVVLVVSVGGHRVGHAGCVHYSRVLEVSPSALE
eukprot:CAMPEP_0116911252 /NCGR_PEP_ID=MMETSP0467-20121206/15376_1 /TAXON_ID=283647 /ORGANISM="Mesodinium pulex, Strain SPMC105" /LENGTH=262 /DNA_ID=CAMNT_0004586997 /DNA_START=176 /DNA_END=965 /DNA_ORIENTATION=+